MPLNLIKLVSPLSVSLLHLVKQKLMIIAIDDGSAIQNALREMNGQSSVPNIYIGQKHIGGNSDLQAQKSELEDLLKNAGAL